MHCIRAREYGGVCRNSGGPRKIKGGVRTGWAKRVMEGEIEFKRMEMHGC